MRTRLPQWRLRFQGKVLLPMFLILVTLVGFMFWLVNRHFVHQLHAQARQAVETADAAFAYYQEARTRDLKSRYASLATDSRLRQVLQRDDPKTLEFLLEELLDELGADAAMFTAGTGRSPVGAQKAGGARGADVEPAWWPVVTRAWNGSVHSPAVPAGGSFLGVVSLPDSARVELG